MDISSESLELRVDSTTDTTTTLDPACMSDCQRLENDYPCFDPILPCDRANPPTTADLEEIGSLCDMELNMACMKVSDIE